MGEIGTWEVYLWEGRRVGVINDDDWGLRNELEMKEIERKEVRQRIQGKNDINDVFESFYIYFFASTWKC